MSIIEAILLGIVQGLTEFLPISSSGHLVLGQELLGIVHQKDIAFEVFVHFGTLISVVGMFWKDIHLIILSIVRVISHPSKIKSIYKENYHFRIAVYIIIGSLPAGIIGFMFKNEVEFLFNDPKFVAVMLLITGLILFLTKFSNPREDSKVGLASAIIIGFAQAVAIIPGISRSGITISSGLFLRVSPAHAARFSFLLSLPVIFGATVLEAKELLAVPLPAERFLILFVGTIVAAISGYIAIKLVLGILQKKKFSWFAYYCFLVGILGIFFIG